MKSLFLFVAAIIFIQADAQVQIKGKIRNYDGKSQVSYFPTIEGIHTPYWIYVQPNENGEFVVEFENKGYGTTSVGFKSVRLRLFHTEHSKFYIEIDQAKIKSGRKGRISASEYYPLIDSLRQVSVVKVKGDYQPILNFYQDNLRTAYITPRDVSGDYYSLYLAGLETPGEVLAASDSLMKIELDQIENLSLSLNSEIPTRDKLNPHIIDFLTNEVRAFYGSVFLQAMFLKRKDQMIKCLKDSLALRDSYNRMWEETVEKFVVEMRSRFTPYAYSFDCLQYLESLEYTLGNYQDYYNSHYKVLPMDTYMKMGLFEFDSLIFNHPQLIKAHQLSALQRYLNDPLFYSPALLDAVQYLQHEYPDSENLKFYQPLVEKLKRSLEASALPFDKAIMIEKNHKTLASLLEQFKGNNVFIDIWATWCHPCVEEFQFRPKLQPVLDSLAIKTLYITIDKKDWEDRWLNCIKFNQLAGYHFRGNDKFIISMWEELGGEMAGAIPRYALIDKQGKIFISNATRPSEAEKLIKQFFELSSLSD